MKSLARRVVLMCVCAAAFVPAFAQITITAGVVNAKLAFGRTVNNNVDTLVTSIDIGKPGSTSWDFSALQAHTVASGLSVDPATTPFAAQFPGATFALKSSLAGSYSGFPGPVAGDIYLYFTLAGDLLNPGTMGSGTVDLGPPLGAVPASLSILNSPADVYYHLPSTMGDSWRSAYTATTSYFVAGIPFGGSTKNYDITYSVDAYGTMKLPGGSTVDALRIMFAETGTGLNQGYLFLSDTGALVKLTVGASSQPDSGVIPVQRKSIIWNASSPTAVRTSSGLPQDFALQQNYPNPFNPGTEISYELASASHVTLTVFDLLGRQVAKLVDEEKPAGVYSSRFDASHLASGMYLYRLTAGSFVQMKRMIVLK